MEINDKKIFEQIFNLKGKTAIITGGGGILGGTIAKGLGFAGAKVILTDIFEDKAKLEAKKLSELGIVTDSCLMDAFSKESITRCTDIVEEKHGKIDILVNTAGGNMKGATVSDETDFFDLSQEALEKVVGLNLFAGAIYPCQVIGKRMAKSKGSASIINISSMSAFKPLTKVVGYSAAKAAVSNFTQWLSVYMAKDLKSNVRVNAIAPGFFLTEQNRYLMTKEGGSLTDRGELVISNTPMGKFGKPDDLIGAAVWLASDASSFVTGVVLPIDGGYSAFGGV